MKGRVKLIALIGAVTVMIAGSITYGVMRMEKSKGEFAEDGYVLGEVVVGEAEEADINCYFSAGSKYQKKYPGKVQFEQTDGDKATIEQESFVHFMDDGLMAFSQGVFIDLDTLNEKNLSYFNMPQEVVINKQAGSYIFQASSNEQRFQNFLWKVSDDKYMVVSDQLKLHLSEGNDKELAGYVEINFVDKDVVQLIHQDGTYQTVAADAYIDAANGARIRLADRMVEFGEEDKLALGQMVIDSDDNIEIAVKDEKEEDEDGEGEEDAQAAGEGNETNNSSSSSTSNSNQTSNAQTVVGAGGAGGTGGTGGTGTGTSGSDVPDNNEVDTDVTFPTFSISEMEAGMVSLEANIEITDDDDLLGEKGVDVKILENGSNKLIWQKHVEKGVYAIPINIDVLTPDTEYVLVANSDYTYRDENYNKDFISQVFETNALGVKISKKSVTEDSMTVHVSVDSYSELTSGVMYVTQGENYSTTRGMSFEEIKAAGGSMDVEFNNLNSNTSYDVRVGDLYTGSVMLQSEYDIKGQFTTLKEAPTLGVPNVSINKAQSSFALWLKDVVDDGVATTTHAKPIVDPDEGVKKVVFEVYNTGQIENGEPDSAPLQTIVSDNTASVIAAVDGTVLQRNITYCYRVVVDFYDNEKTVEYVSQISNPFKLDSAKFPSVTFDPQDTELDGVIQNGIEYDSFRGVVTIKDEGNVVLRPNTINMSITGNDGGDVQLKTWDLAADGEMSTSLTVTGLRANTTYTVSLRGMINLQDGNPDMEAYLGSFQLTTLENPGVVQANVTAPKTASEMSRQYAFDVKFRLTDYTDAENATTDAAYELSTMDSVVLEMYTGVRDESGNLTKGALWGRKTLANTNSYEATAYRYDSSIKSTYSDSDTQYVITPETFGMTNSNVTSDSYILVVKDAVDYTDFKNEIDIKKQGGEEAEFEITPHGFVPNLPANVNNTINVSPVLYGTMQEPAGQSMYPVIARSGSADKILGLKSDTIVGYVAHASGFPSNGLQFAKKVTYHMYKVNSFSGDSPDFNSKTEVASQTISVAENATSLPAWQVPVKARTKVERGNVYFFTYEVDLDLSRGEGVEIPAKYPQDAINGNGVVLRSGEEYCEKETPEMRMYLEDMQAHGNNTYSQIYKYQYTDIDNAYTDTPFKIENGTNSIEGNWNSGDGATKTLEISGIQNSVTTLNIRKEMALYNAITGFAGAKSDVLITSQPVNTLLNIPFNNIKYKLEPDASRMKIMLEIPPSINTAELKRIAAVKATVHCEGNEKVFDYLPLDTSYQAYIPLLKMSEFMGKNLTIDVDVYYDNGLMGTAKLGSSTTQNKVLLINYNRTGGYSYQGNTGTAGDSIYTIEPSFVDNIFDVDGSTKSFSATKWKNTDGVENYTGGSAAAKNFALDQQGLSQNTTGSNPDRDTYYVFREIDSKPLSYEGNNNQTKFTYIRPTISNVEIEPGVTDAKVTFRYDGVNKSAVKDGKLYLLLNTTQDYGESATRYEINLSAQQVSSSGSGTVTVNLGSGGNEPLDPDQIYYFTVTAKLQADGREPEELRLLEDNAEVSRAFRTLSQVTFTNCKYSYLNNSYADKEMRFEYGVDVVSGYTVKLVLKDTTSNKEIELGDRGTVSNLVSKNMTRFPVGNSTASDYDPIEGVQDLVYGHSYTLTGTAVTAAGREVGTFTISFVLEELESPFFSVTSIASKTNNVDSIQFTVVANDTTFAMIDEKYTIRVYEEKNVNTETATPVYTKECRLDISTDGTHQARTTTVFTLGANSTGKEKVTLKPDADYTLVITTTADKGYGDTTRQTPETKVYTTKTLNDYGIAYGRVFATPDSSGDIKLDFYDTVGFAKVRSMDYSIYADTKQNVAPISGTITGLTFTGDANQRSISVPAGLTVSDTYTMRINLKNADGVIVATEEIGFSYSNNRMVNAVMQMLQN